MKFETEFHVACSPEVAIERFSDIPAMASLLPGASVGPANPDGSYPATLVVSFGPKRITFNGAITNATDREKCSGVLTGRASVPNRAARMSVKMAYTLHHARAGEGAAPVSEGTRVCIVSEAELTGVLAEFAKTGGPLVTNAILGEFARGFSARYGGPGNSSAAVASAGAELSAMTLGKAMARSAVTSVKQAIGMKSESDRTSQREQ